MARGDSGDSVVDEAALKWSDLAHESFGCRVDERCASCATLLLVASVLLNASTRPRCTRGVLLSQRTAALKKTHRSLLIHLVSLHASLATRELVAFGNCSLASETLSHPSPRRTQNLR